MLKKDTIFDHTGKLFSNDFNALLQAHLEMFDGPNVFF